MAGVTKEEIARAKELDLLTYFKLVEPGNLKLVGKEYRHKVHSSLTISKDSLWCWHCIGLRGRTALKYLVDVEKVPYVEAVREINRIQGGVIHSSQPVSLPQPRAEPEAPRDFKLPESDTNSYAAMAYLRGRCIHPNVLAFCRKEGILYQTSFKITQTAYLLGATVRVLRKAAACAAARSCNSGVIFPEARKFTRSTYRPALRPTRLRSTKRPSMPCPARHSSSCSTRSRGAASTTWHWAVRTMRRWMRF